MPTQSCLRLKRRSRPGRLSQRPLFLLQVRVFNHTYLALVLSESIKWVPQGAQEEIFRNDPIRPKDADILIAKLNEGQELDLELHCIKGLGKDHSKWSPVCKIYFSDSFIILACSSYRLLPKIELLEPITGPDAQKLVECFPNGVLELKTKHNTCFAVVANPRVDTVSRNYLRHPELAKKVAQSRVPDHFICIISSNSSNH